MGILMYTVLESKKQWGDFQPNVIPLVNKYKHSILFRIIFQKPLAYFVIPPVFLSIFYDFIVNTPKLKQPRWMLAFYRIPRGICSKNQGLLQVSGQGSCQAPFSDGAIM